MTTTADIPLFDLDAHLNGKVIAPHDPRYDDARGVFFTGFDRRPAAIARVANASDVSRVVNFARETGAELAVRSGGHSRGGYGSVDGGIVLDLSEMNAVEIDVDSRTAWAQTGATAGGYTGAAGGHGLATGFGDAATVGIGGITLSGGIGFLVRKHGLTIDQLLGAEVVTADGELLEVDEDNHADLFWALRGGGGNFGVVTRLRFRLHEVDEVVGGMLLLPASAEVITGLVAAADAAPNELSVIANIAKAPPLPFIPAERHGKPVVMAQMVYAGGAEAAERAIAPIRALATALADMVRPIRYREMFEGPEGPRPGFDAGTNVLVDGLAPQAAEAILEHLETSTAQMGAAQLRVLGGAMARVPDGATAFGHRLATIMVNIAAMYANPDERRTHEAWVASLATAVSDGSSAAYAGFLGDSGDQGVRRAYPPATLERLAEVKRKYDPENLFRLNANVPPAAN
ncbi:MAG: FAD-binding oxidoreductase [Thermoleophilaceae bacterium]